MDNGSGSFAGKTRVKRHWIGSLLGGMSLAGLALAYCLASLPILLVSLIGMGCFGARQIRWHRRCYAQAAGAVADKTETPVASPASDAASLVDQMLAVDRYALLLRPQIAEQLEANEVARALAMLEAKMALVPAGQVVVGPINEALEDGKIDINSLHEAHAQVLEIEPVFLDRYPVTNAQFHQFVADGGYEELEIWDPEILGAVLDFVDQTGQPGPRFWRDGCFPQGEANLPVVGVCWYEAVAYARWSGKRLPTAAEWVKAGSWPVAPRPDVWLLRRYPWGNAFDPAKANLWCSGEGRIVPVDQYEEGVSVGGIYQLIGNVWEWTADNYGWASDISLRLPMPMKSIRGGAFDTYFENQATCHFQSGESPLNRKHNIGFRLALSPCDVAGEHSLPLAPEAAVDTGHEVGV